VNKVGNLELYQRKIGHFYSRPNEATTCCTSYQI